MMPPLLRPGDKSRSFLFAMLLWFSTQIMSKLIALEGLYFIGQAVWAAIVSSICSLLNPIG